MIEAPALPLAELSAWLVTAEVLIDRQMAPDDPRRPAATEQWLERLAEYEARCRAGEVE